jgi:hypothetical protein
MAGADSNRFLLFDDVTECDWLFQKWVPCCDADSDDRQFGNFLMNVISGNVALQNLFETVNFVDMRPDANEPERCRERL